MSTDDRLPQVLQERHHVQIDILLQALPYIQRFNKTVVVVKFGGNAMESDELASQFAQDIVLMHQVGIRPVVVHGGGPQIGEWLGRLGIESEFVDGRRVTDAETLEIAQMVLVGKVNSEIVSRINSFGPTAVGLAGTDGALLRVEAAASELGFVGHVKDVNIDLVNKLLEMDIVPVISTIGVDYEGQAYNINADDAAAAIAEHLGAEKLMFLSNVPGLLRDVSDPESLVRQITSAEAEAAMIEGWIAGGMIPKVEGCIHALTHGVGSVHLIDGRVPHALLLELFTDAGVGTMLVGEGEMIPSTKKGGAK